MSTPNSLYDHMRKTASTPCLPLVSPPATKHPSMPAREYIISCTTLPPHTRGAALPTDSTAMPTAQEDCEQWRWTDATSARRKIDTKNSFLVMGHITVDVIVICTAFPLESMQCQPSSKPQP